MLCKTVVEIKQASFALVGIRQKFPFNSVPISRIGLRRTCNMNNNVNLDKDIYLDMITDTDINTDTDMDGEANRDMDTNNYCL